jgi:ribosomal protein S18 acetylase RimI-like enzyme
VRNRAKIGKIMIRFLEEVSLNTWPALHTQHFDGWILRFANGYTRRANSVSPLYPSALPALQKIAYCEKIYNAQGLPTVFKLTSAAQPENLDELLAEQGYRHDAQTSTQTLDLENMAAPQTDNVRLTEQLTDDWLAAYCRMTNVAERNIAPMKAILNGIVSAHCFATHSVEGEPTSFGVAALERGYLILFDIVTGAEFRNRGLAREVILSLLRWGKANGARHAFLQVMIDNPPALHLYEKLGFREVYQYWYRVKSFEG